MKTKKGKCGPKTRAESIPSNGEIFSLKTNFCTELEQFCCSPWVDFTCLWDTSLKIKCQVFQKFIFPPQRCYGPQKNGKGARLGVLTWPSLAYFDVCVASYSA